MWKYIIIVFFIYLGTGANFQIDDFSVETPILYVNQDIFQSSVLTLSDSFFGHHRLLSMELSSYQYNMSSFTYISNGNWFVWFHQNDFVQSSLKWYDEIASDFSATGLYFKFTCEVDIPTTILLTLGDLLNHTETKFISVVAINYYQIPLSSFHNIDTSIINFIEMKTIVTDNIDLTISDVKITSNSDKILFINENYPRCSPINDNISPSPNTYYHYTTFSCSPTLPIYYMIMFFSLFLSF